MKIIKCNGCPEKEATLDIATMTPGTVFMDGGAGPLLRTNLPLGTIGAVVELEDGCTYDVRSQKEWTPTPLDSDYLIPKEQS